MFCDTVILSKRPTFSCQRSRCGSAMIGTRVWHPLHKIPTAHQPPHAAPAARRDQFASLDAKFCGRIAGRRSRALFSLRACQRVIRSGVEGCIFLLRILLRVSSDSTACGLSVCSKRAFWSTLPRHRVSADALKFRAGLGASVLDTTSLIERLHPDQAQAIERLPIRLPGEVKIVHNIRIAPFFWPR